MLKAEGAGVAEGGHRLILPGRPVGMGTILDESQIVVSAQPAQGIHVGHAPGNMDNGHGPGPLRDGGLGGGHVETAVAGIDVDEHRDGIHHQDGRGRGQERPGRHEHLVTLAHPHGAEGQLDGMGTVGDGGGRARAVEAPPRSLELPHLRSFGRPPVAGVEDFQKSGPLVAVPHRPARVGRGTNRGSAVDGQLFHYRSLRDRFSGSNLVRARIGLRRPGPSRAMGQPGSVPKSCMWACSTAHPTAPTTPERGPSSDRSMLTATGTMRSTALHSGP